MVPDPAIPLPSAPTSRLGRRAHQGTPSWYHRQTRARSPPGVPGSVVVGGGARTLTRVKWPVMANWLPGLDEVQLQILLQPSGASVSPTQMQGCAGGP